MFTLLLLSFAPLLPQNSIFSPGDIVIADPSDSYTSPKICILHPDGSTNQYTLPSPITYPDAILVDNDGSLLVSNYQSQWGPNNGIWSIDFTNNSAYQLNIQPLEDNFKFCRDTEGNLIVADGFAGLAKINPSGQVSWFSPPSYSYDPSVGIALDYDGGFIVSEPPNYLGGSSQPGFIHKVDRLGNRSIIATDINILPKPQGLSIDDDGSILVSDGFGNVGGGLDRMGVVRVFRDGTMNQIAWGGLLEHPVDVIPLRYGFMAVADSWDSSIIMVPPGGAAPWRLLWDLDDGLANSNPIGYPRDLCKIPFLWVNCDSSVGVGNPTQIKIRALKSWAHQSVLVAASLVQSPTPLSTLWPGDVRTSHVDLNSAQWRRGRLGPNGETNVILTVPYNPHLIGKRLHIQVFLPREREMSNYVSLLIR
ncbi:MAG: hypothetical protein QGH51_08760 [Planctomycetota bacterium]|jgi:hypothetical protein|nr:hypothetical protein [Planctomycetota bacterium]